MAPAQMVDLPQTKKVYNHKKFHGNRYSHKKFGTRSNPSLVKSSENSCKDQYPILCQMDKEHTANNKTSTTKYKNDIFRPYALDEETPVSRKRKYQELQLESADHQQESQLQFNESHQNKIFAASPSTNTLDARILFPTAQMNFPYSSPPVFYGLPKCQLNSQTLAIILQKQQAALYLGEILKRQPHFDRNNLWRN